MSTQTPYPCPATPPHCPNPECAYSEAQSGPWPYIRFGSFTRLKPPYTVPRFRCKACGRTFSSQTFETSYWLKRPDLLPQVQKHAVSGAANRQVARVLETSPATVDLHIERLGRHCILFHRQFMEKASPTVDVILDGLVTFEYSQYLPYEVIAALDGNTSFVTHFAEAERRRSGTMTDEQKRKRQEFESMVGRPDPHALMKAVVEVVSETVRGAVWAHVWSDKHKTYPFALKKIRWCHFDHETVDSREPRTYWNPLFEVNLLDMLMRHCLKDHTRETIAFGRRRNNSMYRMAIFLVWRNYIKLRREKRCRSTPAMLKGLTDHPLTEEEVLSTRLFVWHFELPGLWADYYWRRVETRALKVNRRHELKYAM